MRRLVLAFVVAILTVSASGVSSLVIAEPCTGDEPPGRSDSACPPTCLTCGCCPQAVEPVDVVVATSPDALVAGIVAAFPGFPDVDPRPILHVPRLRPA